MNSLKTVFLYKANGGMCHEGIPLLACVVEGSMSLKAVVDRLSVK